MKGYVYVLTNPSMPGLVKIGRSKISGFARAESIYKGDTGVPQPFEVHFECIFENCIEAEAALHEDLREFRLNPKREFFVMEPDDAVLAVVRERSIWLNHTVVDAELEIDEVYLSYLASQLDLPLHEVTYALNHVNLDELLLIRERLENPKRAETKKVFSIIPAGGSQ